MPVLDWIGKAAVVDHVRHVPFRLLETDAERSTDVASENVIVEGTTSTRCGRCCRTRPGG